jgi:hypothetical protein
MRFALTFLLLSLSFPAVAAEKKDYRYITISGTRLLAKPSAFSATITKLASGTKVWVVKTQGAYLYISTASAEKPGWIASRSVQSTKPRITAGAKGSSDASAEEVAAATKGFNSQVEAKYSKDNPKLNYGQLDALEARTAFPDPMEGLKDFRQKGKLGEFSEGSHE